MVAVARVLPWERSLEDDSVVRPVIDSYQERWPDSSPDLITLAYDAANAAHEGQRRKSGEPYIYHPVAVATVVADLGLDDATIAAALLHDAVEDTNFSLDEVRREFGDDVAAMVDGVTKLDRLRFETKQAQEAATMRKMLVAMAKDLRVLLIKLSDRLHNMRTLGALSSTKQERIARETLDIYAPLAHRLGMQDMRQQLEDLSFAALYPKRFAEVDRLVAARTPERRAASDDVLEEVRSRLLEMNVDAQVTGRHKHLWSIYEKMVVKGREFNDIFDLVGVRIVVGSVRDCYAALGCIHATWRPVQGRFKDYVAMPKFNLYQSLHTTVIGPKGSTAEVQIRTHEMHHRAEYGVAAHWRYKSGGDQASADLPWLTNLVDWQQETDDPDEFMATLKVDLELDEVFVFTPLGDVVTMAVGATPIDFAYAIHTDVGHGCIGARVNGRLVPLQTDLQSGDTVEVFTSKVAGAGPSRDWLSIAGTPRARNKIRQWFARERRDDAIDAGREAISKELRRAGLPVQKLLKSEQLLHVASDVGYQDLEALFAAVGEKNASPKSVAQRTQRLLREDGAEEQLPAPAVHDRTARRHSHAGVNVEGLSDVMVRLARCCTPVPGDEILGFITRGRGVSVHRSDCANAVSLSTEHIQRVIEVDWDVEERGAYIVAIEVRALDRERLLADVSAVMADQHVNITGATTHTGEDRVSVMKFEFELADPSHLGSLLRSVRAIPAVYDAQRVLPGRGQQTKRH